ncbi:MAG: trypsin-like peptidase domain-containing protein [Planctomycetota bacterium]
MASIERRVRTVYETANPAVVRIEWKTDRRSGLSNGVIVTADGYVVTGNDPVLAIHQGGSSDILLAGGRRVMGAALGWSQEWGVGLMKITEPGSWPHVKLGSTANIKAGQLCVALRYTKLAGNQWNRQPTLYLGSVTRSAAGVWFSSSTTGSIGSIFDLEGRLVGLTTSIWTHSGDITHTSIEVIRTHWDDLAAGKNLDRARLLSSEKATGESPKATGPKTQGTAEQQRVSAALEKAKLATVRIRMSGEEKGWSGVIVTSDGYVVTCAHHSTPLPGQKVTISLSDGRDVAGKILGTNWVSDISLMKIKEKGPWPHTEFGNSTTMRSDEPCLVMGYPATRQERQPLVRRAQIDVRQDDSWSCFLFTSQCPRYGGDSGGGVFDLEGRVVAVMQGGWPRPRHLRVELFRKQWDFLAAGKPVDAITSEPLGEITAAFRRVANDLGPIVVEVLGDKKPRVLGTIVHSNGRILTKASELYGALSCRLADGRILPATVEKESREHDLAVLKVDASNLPAAEFSLSEKTPVGTLVAALTPGKPALAGVICHPDRPIPREGGWAGVGVRDGDRGLEVDEDERARGFDIPLRKGDIILHVEGHREMDREAFFKLTEFDVHCAGDPIRIGVKRGDQTLEFRFPLPPSSYMIPYSPPEYESLRCSAFPSVFETDIPLTPKMCGGPVIDKTGRVAGVAIGCRNRGRIYVIPAAVARKVVKQP